jgi:hypothetical protein
MSRTLLVVLLVLLACANQSTDRTERPAGEGATPAAGAGAPAGTPGGQSAPPAAGESAPPAAGESAPLSVADQVRALDARLASLEVTRGSADMRGTMTRYRAHWEKDAVVMIEEEADLGAQGPRKARYYYDESGRLIHYTEGPMLTMSFDASGTMIDGAKSAGGAPAGIEPFEVNAAQMRGRELRTAVTMGTGH